MKEKLTSRKFLLALGYILLKVIADALGWEIPREVLYAVLGYLGVEGLVDFGRTWTCGRKS